MNEWMNEWCIYIALHCVLLYNQSALQSCGGGGGGGGVSPQPPPYTLWIAYVNIISTNFLNQIYALKVE